MTQLPHTPHIAPAAIQFAVGFFGLQQTQLANEINGPLLIRFAAMPLLDLMIVGTLNHRVPGSSPGAPTIQSSQTARFRYDSE
jgi:hypothetical protein